MASAIGLAVLAATVAACTAPPSGAEPDSGVPSADAGITPSPDDARAPADARPPADAAAPLTAPFLWAPIQLEGSEDRGHTPTELPPDARTPAGPLALVETAASAGLGTATGGGSNHGVAVAFVDLNGDDSPDIFVANGSKSDGTIFPSRLFINDGAGSFADATEAAGLTAALSGRDLYSVAAADYDADGDVDLYLGAHPLNILLRNNGDGTFADATDAANAGGVASVLPAGGNKLVAFGDIDGDGRLDLVTASRRLPEPKAFLLRNLGDGTFEDVTVTSGVQSDPEGHPCALMWTDYDNDGKQDIWIWNDGGGHRLLHNVGGSFDEVSATASAVDIGNPMGMDGADIDRDGDLDYYVGNIGPHPLLENQGDGTFVDITNTAGTRGGFGWGLGFEDFDQDGWMDLFVTQEDNRPYYLYRNLGTQPSTFTRADVAHPAILDAAAAHNVAAAFADYDRDGRVDAVSVNTDGSRINLFRNETDVGTNHYLRVRIEAAPGTGERGGVAARVGVVTGDTIQFRDVTAGASRASQSDLSVQFGLGAWDGAHVVFALWADGRQLVVRNVAANQTVALSAP